MLRLNSKSELSGADEMYCQNVIKKRVLREGVLYASCRHGFTSATKKTCLLAFFDWLPQDSRRYLTTTSHYTTTWREESATARRRVGDRCVLCVSQAWLVLSSFLSFSFPGVYSSGHVTQHKTLLLAQQLTFRMFFSFPFEHKKYLSSRCKEPLVSLSLQYFRS